MMKKLLLSAAVIAVSGAYVAYEDHGGASSLALDAGTSIAPTSAHAAPAASLPSAAPPALDSAPAAVAPSATPTTAAIAPAPSAALVPTTARALSQTASLNAPADPPSQPASDSAATIDAIIAAAPSAAAATAPRPVPVTPAAPPRQTADATIPLPLPRPADAPQPSAAPVADASSTDSSIQTVAATGGTAQSGYGNGTFKGISADAYYGRVQVAAVITSGRLTSIRILDYPSDRARSAYIASRSIPILEREAISAQSGHIDSVSGATLTSRAFIQSLDSALAAARTGGGNA